MQNMLTCFLNGFRTSNVHNLKIYHSNLNRLYSSKIVNMHPTYSSVELQLALNGSNKLSKIYDLQLPQCIHVYNKKLQRNISHVITIMANQSPIIEIISYVLLQINSLNKIFKDRLHTNTLPV